MESGQTELVGLPHNFRFLHSYIISTTNLGATLAEAGTAPLPPEVN